VADVVSAVNRVCGIDGWLWSATECWVKGHVVAAGAESVGSVARPAGVVVMSESVEVSKSSFEFDLPSSIQIERNTKGYNWTVKLRCKPGDESGLVGQLEELDKLLRSKFGGGSA